MTNISPVGPSATLFVDFMNYTSMHPFMYSIFGTPPPSLCRVYSSTKALMILQAERSCPRPSLHWLGTF